MFVSTNVTFKYTGHSYIFRGIFFQNYIASPSSFYINIFLSFSVLSYFPYFPTSPLLVFTVVRFYCRCVPTLLSFIHSPRCLVLVVFWFFPLNLLYVQDTIFIHSWAESTEKGKYLAAVVLAEVNHPLPLH